MKEFKCLYLCVFISLLSIAAFAQEPQSLGQVVLPNTESFIFETENTQEDFLIQVSFPPNFDRSGNTEYPVVYLTDANNRFSLFRDIYYTMLRGGEVVPLIIVGIGYEIETQRDVVINRSRDMTPIRSIPAERELNVPLTGDGPIFTTFITEELIPYIDNTYSTNNTRIYSGFSLGGLFGLSLLFDTKEVFSHYIIGSPALHVDVNMFDENDGLIGKSYMFEHESKYAAKNTDLKAQVFFSVGLKEGDSILPNTAKFYSILSSRNYSGLTLGIKYFEEETHATAPTRAYAEGLRFVGKSLTR